MTREPVVRREEKELVGQDAQVAASGEVQAAAAALNKETQDRTSLNTESRTEEVSRSAEGKNGEFRRRQREDDLLRDISDFLEIGKTPEDKTRAGKVAAMASHMLVQNGVLYNLWWMAGGPTGGSMTRQQLVIPSGPWREEILGQYHDSQLGGHMGYEKTYGRIREEFWWPEIVKDVKQYVRSCMVCQQRSPADKDYGLLQPVVATEPWQHVVMDFGELIESESGNRNVLAFTCSCSKEVELIATKDQTAVTVATHLLERVIYRHGTPAKLVSDRAPGFIAEVLKETAERLGIKQAFSTAYHPQSHGQVENTFKQTWKLLKGVVSKHQRDWDRHLAGVEAAIRFTPNRSTGVSPFKMLHGAEPRMPASIQLPTVRFEDEVAVESPKELAKERENRIKEVRDNAKERVEKAQEAMKKQYDKKRVPAGPEFEVGRKVLLHNKKLEFEGTTTKLARPWQGPYEVVEKKGDLNRVVRGIDNPNDQQCVHVERLKPFIERTVTGKDKAGNEAAANKGPGGTNEKEEFEIDEILQEKAESGKTYYLIKWKGYTNRNNSWVPEEDLEAEETLVRFKLREEERRRTPLPGRRRAETKLSKPIVGKKEGPTQVKEKAEQKEDGAYHTMDKKEKPTQVSTRSGRVSRPKQIWDL